MTVTLQLEIASLAVVHGTGPPVWKVPLAPQAPPYPYHACSEISARSRHVSHCGPPSRCLVAGALADLVDVEAEHELEGDLGLLAEGQGTQAFERNVSLIRVRRVRSER